MTKDQMRALLADLVPPAVARGDVYKFHRVGSGNAPKIDAVNGVSMRTNEQPQVRPVRPRSMYQRQGIYGAGFVIPTYKPFQGVSKDDPVQDRAADATAYYCFMCEKFGKDCSC
jgi:hypothetical protein